MGLTFCEFGLSRATTAPLTYPRQDNTDLWTRYCHQYARAYTLKGGQIKETLLTPAKKEGATPNKTSSTNLRSNPSCPGGQSAARTGRGGGSAWEKFANDKLLFSCSCGNTLRCRVVFRQGSVPYWCVWESKAKAIGPGPFRYSRLFRGDTYVCICTVDFFNKTNLWSG